MANQQPQLQSKKYVVVKGAGGGLSDNSGNNSGIGMAAGKKYNF